MPLGKTKMSAWKLKNGPMNPVEGPVLVIVMDGVGLGPADEGNAVHLAKTPTLDHLWNEHGCLAIKAHGKAVGLPNDKDMGNSEVGHNALGAGRIFEQGASLVGSVDRRTLAGSTWQWLTQECAKRPLYWPAGGVHSHEIIFTRCCAKRPLKGSKGPSAYSPRRPRRRR